ncbi:hypothetical protein GWI33_010936, partial [Rhynchophorus ferrugineus]
GFGLIVFSPLAQGLLGGRYLQGIPEDSRVGKGSRYLTKQQLDPVLIKKIEKLQHLANQRGQTLAQFALSWVLRDPHVSSAIIGASKPEQVLENLKSLQNTHFDDDEIRTIEVILAE